MVQCFPITLWLSSFSNFNSEILTETRKNWKTRKEKIGLMMRSRWENEVFLEKKCESKDINTHRELNQENENNEIDMKPFSP